MTEVIETQKIEVAQELNVVATDSAALILDAKSMDSMYRLAEIMAKGRSTIPDHLKGNTGDCMAIVMQAIQWRMNPFSVAQKTHTVNGVLGYEGQLVNAVITSSGITKDRLNYHWFGPWEKIIGKTKVIKMPAKGDKKEYEFRVPDYSMADEAGLGIKVWATLKGEDGPRELELLLVQASVRNSPLWASDPKQQLAYLAAKRWARLHAPDVILGVYTPDELEEPATIVPRDITPHQSMPAKPEPSAALLNQARTESAAGVSAYAKFWSSTGKENRKLLDLYHADLKSGAEKADRDRTIDVPAQQSEAKPMSDFDSGMDSYTPK